MGTDHKPQIVWSTTVMGPPSHTTCQGQEGPGTQVWDSQPRLCLLQQQRRQKDPGGGGTVSNGDFKPSKCELCGGIRKEPQRGRQPGPSSE